MKYLLGQTALDQVRETTRRVFADPNAWRSPTDSDHRPHPGPEYRPRRFHVRTFVTPSGGNRYEVVDTPVSGFSEGSGVAGRAWGPVPGQTVAVEIPWLEDQELPSGEEHLIYAELTWDGAGGWTGELKTAPSGLGSSRYEEVSGTDVWRIPVAEVGTSTARGNMFVRPILEHDISLQYMGLARSGVVSGFPQPTAGLVEDEGGYDLLTLTAATPAVSSRIGMESGTGRLCLVLSGESGLSGRVLGVYRSGWYPGEGIAVSGSGLVWSGQELAMRLVSGPSLTVISGEWSRSGVLFSVQRSITWDGAVLQLVNDMNSPSEGYFYGVSGGIRGWYPPDISGAGEDRLVAADSVDAAPGTLEEKVSGNSGSVQPMVYANEYLNLRLDGDVVTPNQYEFYGYVSGKGWHDIPSLLEGDGLSGIAAGSSGNLAVKTAVSVILDPSGAVTLSGDSDPGPNFFYGTGPANLKGWYVTGAIGEGGEGIGSGSSGTLAVKVKQSIEIDTDNHLHLVGDIDTPSEPSYYGYSGGVRGWFQPAASTDRFVAVFSGDTVPATLDEKLQWSEGSISGRVEENLGDSLYYVSLINDEVSPGVFHHYGTDVSGVRGWFPVHQLLMASGDDTPKYMADFLTPTVAGPGLTGGVAGQSCWVSGSGILLDHNDDTVFPSTGAGNGLGLFSAADTGVSLGMAATYVSVAPYTATTRVLRVSGVKATFSGSALTLAPVGTGSGYAVLFTTNKNNNVAPGPWVGHDGQKIWISGSGVAITGGNTDINPVLYGTGRSGTVLTVASGWITPLMDMTVSGGYLCYRLGRVRHLLSGGYLALETTAPSGAYVSTGLAVGDCST